MSQGLPVKAPAPGLRIMAVMPPLPLPPVVPPLLEPVEPPLPDWLPGSLGSPPEVTVQPIAPRMNVTTTRARLVKDITCRHGPNFVMADRLVGATRTAPSRQQSGGGPMRNGLTRLAQAMMLAWAMAGAGCSSSGGGSTSGSGGATSSGGNSGSGGTTSSGGNSGSGGATGAGGGSAAGGSHGTTVTTLPGGTASNALSTAQASQLCDDTYAYFGSAIPMATKCKWQGLAYGASSSAPSASILQQKCMTQSTSCSQTTDPWATNNGCSDLPKTCTATVADYAACIAAEVTLFTQTVGALPDCSALMMSDVSAIMDAETGGTLPDSCASLMNSCPDLYPPTPLSQ